MNMRPRSLNLAFDTDSIIHTDEQTTLRVSKEMHEKLRVLAALEGQTIMAVTQTIIGDYLNRYEDVTGQSLLPRRRSQKP